MQVGQKRLDGVGFVADPGGLALASEILDERIEVVGDRDGVGGEVIDHLLPDGERGPGMERLPGLFNPVTIPTRRGGLLGHNREHLSPAIIGG